MPLLPDSIRFSETLEASPAALIAAVREQGFEGFVAKRRASLYEPGKRSGARQKMRVLQRREFTIGGYTPAGRTFDAILIGDYQGRALQYVAKVRAGFTPALRSALFKQFAGLETKTCSFKNLPEARPVGRRTDGRGNEEVPLAATAAGRVDRIFGTTSREPPTAPDFRGTEQESARSCACKPHNRASSSQNNDLA